MREIAFETVAQTVASLFMEANYVIGPDITCALQTARQRELSPVGRDVLDQILENNQIAREERVAICQDTGMAVLFARMGSDLHIQGGTLPQAVEEGVRRAYARGYLRKSVVDDPLFDRKNTQDNTPAILHVDLCGGDRLELCAAPKGFGSENMSAVKMLVPADGVEGVVRFVVDTVRRAGPNPCPPVVVGVGIGGSFEKAALLAKKALTRPVDQPNPDPRYAQLEQRLLGEINALGIGPAGTGGSTTALGVNIEQFPTHIAGMPVAVNICCHAARHASAVL